MNVSDSSWSKYWGNPFSVFRVIEGSARLQPKPNGPFPEPESYDRDSCGPKPERPGEVKIGTVKEPVPVTGLAANFSPIPRIAPPPLGSVMDGAVSWFLSGVLCSSWFAVLGVSANMRVSPSYTTHYSMGRTRCHQQERLSVTSGFSS